MRRTSCVLVAAALLSATPARGDDTFALHRGDRVVFFGDSITEQRLYTRFVQQYVYCRSPELDVRFFNAGWGGDTAAGAKARLDRDVLALKPTVVTLFFGMNDGGYRKPTDAVVAAYRANLTDVVKQLKAKSVRVVVFSPPCCDEARSAKLASCDYDKTLEALTQAASEVAKSEGCAFGDVFHPTRDFLAARHKEDARCAIVPDGVHPDAEGHLVVALQMLRALGAAPMPAIGSIDAASGKGAGLKIVSKSDEEIVLATTAPVATPFWFDPGHLRTMHESGFLETLAGQRISVTGLPRERYYVSVDGAESETSSFSIAAADLARGATLPGGGGERAKSIHDLLVKKELDYFHAWRNVRLAMAEVPGVDKAYESLLAFDDQFHALLRTRAAPATVTIRLTPAPSGANLALHKRCESSDANTHGWAGGLTDGSWDEDAEHCFATGEADKFPKSVTIDLESVVAIGSVKFGVPAFGSTRHVEASWSADGKEFTPFATVEFATRKPASRTLVFAPVRARYVRLTYLDHWPDEVQYPPTFCFTTECEVYGAK